VCSSFSLETPICRTPIGDEDVVGLTDPDDTYGNPSVTLVSTSGDSGSFSNAVVNESSLDPRSVIGNMVDS
jgi:hypothetical protein